MLRKIVFPSQTNRWYYPTTRDFNFIYVVAFVLLEVRKETSEDLEYVHSKGFIHKDIESDNVLFKSPLASSLPGNLKPVLIHFDKYDEKAKKYLLYININPNILSDIGIMTEREKVVIEIICPAGLDNTNM